VEADVYCDLRRKCASVRARRGPNAGRVVDKPVRVVVREVTFRVQRGGQQAARASGQRNVHAIACGRVDGADVESVRSDPAAVRLHYNPFRNDTFVAEDGTPVLSAQALAIDGKTAWVIR
jgi:hypothetical protein